MTDHGKKPFVVNIEEATLGNEMYRNTLWTGEHLQMTVMAIPVGGDIGLEVHQENDQFIRIEAGKGLCEMGATQDNLDFSREVHDDDVILVPAGMWHNVTNTGNETMKLYALYGPADHLPGAQHQTKQDAENDPNEH